MQRQRTTLPGKQPDEDVIDGTVERENEDAEITGPLIELHDLSLKVGDKSEEVLSEPKVQPNEGTEPLNKLETPQKVDKSFPKYRMSIHDVNAVITSSIMKKVQEESFRFSDSKAAIMQDQDNMQVKDTYQQEFDESKVTKERRHLHRSSN